MTGSAAEASGVPSAGSAAVLRNWRRDARVMEWNLANVSIRSQRKGAQRRVVR